MSLAEDKFIKTERKPIDIVLYYPAKVTRLQCIKNQIEKYLKCRKEE